jgi:hypothetical protein
MWSPEAEGRSLIENTSFCGFSAGLRRPNQLAPLAEFLFLADLPPYSPNLNSLDFDTWHVLQAKAQATPHLNFSALRPSIAAE